MNFELSNYEIIKILKNADTVNMLLKPHHEKSNCKHCNSVNIRKKGVKHQAYYDIPIENKKTIITIEVQKYYCKDCKRTFQNDLIGISDTHNMTKSLVSYIHKQSFLIPFTHIANKTGVSEGNIRKIFKSYAKALEAKLSITTSNVLYFNEVKLVGKIRTVIIDVNRNTIVEILKDTKESDILNFLNNLKDKTKISKVVIGIRCSYKNIIKQIVPGAIIVISKDSMIKIIYDLLETFRKEFRSTLKTSKKNDLRNDKLILQKRKHELSIQDQRKMTLWKNDYSFLMDAYSVKEQFLNIYMAASKEEALDLYENIISRLDVDIKHCFDDLLLIVKDNEKEIFSYFDSLEICAYNYSLNILINQMIDMNKHSSFEVVRAKILYFK